MGGGGGGVSLLLATLIYCEFDVMKLMYLKVKNLLFNISPETHTYMYYII